MFPGFLPICLTFASFLFGLRNDYRFRSEPPSALRLLACLKARVRFYLPLFFKRFYSDHRRRYFSRQWGGNGVIGHLDGISFKVIV